MTQIPAEYLVQEIESEKYGQNKLDYGQTDGGVWVPKKVTEEGHTKVEQYGSIESTKSNANSSDPVEIPAGQTVELFAIQKEINLHNLVLIARESGVDEISFNIYFWGGSEWDSYSVLGTTPSIRGSRLIQGLLFEPLDLTGSLREGGDGFSLREPNIFKGIKVEASNSDGENAHEVNYSFTYSEVNE